jgi:hypothetical protein
LQQGGIDRPETDVALFCVEGGDARNVEKLFSTVRGPGHGAAEE